MNLAHVPRWWRTVRHLRYSQLWWRGKYVLQRRRAMPAAHAAAPSIAPPTVRPASEWVDVPDFHGGVNLAQTVEELAQGIFGHLNHKVALGRRQTDWRLGPCNRDRLWTVTLHYHGWAQRLAEAAHGGNREASLQLEHYLGDWLERCTAHAPGARDLAWNVFATATRITWWIRTWRTLGDAWWHRRPELANGLLHSLAEQADYVHSHLEWDLRANHLLRDAVGLAWAGRFFAGPAAARWLRTARDLAADQADEQVLPDGAHSELSPLYHVQAMEDFLTLALLIDDPFVAEKLGKTWTKMADYLAWMRHPDGDIPLFGDSALGAVCPPGKMFDLGQRRLNAYLGAPRCGGRYFASAGMVAWHDPTWSVFWDVGRLGLEYQPAHGHADVLCFEASYRGRRVFVDPGVFAYDDDPRRRAQRGTATHNTVCIDGQDSSELWGIFRAGRRARPCDVQISLGADRWRGSASHDGYEHLPGRPRHAREMFVENRTIRIVDRLQGGQEHTAAGGLLLEPSWSARAEAGGWRIADHRGAALAVRTTADRPLDWSIESATYSPQYGLELPTTRLAWRYRGTFPLAVTTTITPA